MELINSDIPELEGSDCEIVLENLKELEIRLGSLIEERIAHIHELSQAVIDDGGEPDIVKSIILSFKSDIDETAAKSNEILCPGLNSIHSSLSMIERLILIKSIVSRPEFSVENYSLESFFRVSTQATDKIAYLKNSFADNAYIQFSSMLSSPKAAYYERTDDVCESVVNGDCEYCIIPLETSDEGKLKGFCEKILRYDLKIMSVCDIKHSSDKRHTKFALLSRNLFFNNTVKAKSRLRYFEFAFRCEEYPTLTDILTAADFCSLRLVRIDTLSSGKLPLINPVFRIDNADISTFIAFLSIDCPKFIPIGIYTQI